MLCLYYSGSYMVNWSPSLQTAVSDLVSFWFHVAYLFYSYLTVQNEHWTFSFLCIGSRIFWRIWYSLLYQVSCCWRFKVVTRIFSNLLSKMCSYYIWSMYLLLSKQFFIHAYCSFFNIIFLTYQKNIYIYQLFGLNLLAWELCVCKSHD